MQEGIYFEFPELLHLLWVLPIQVLLLWVYWRWRQRTLRLLGSKALEERLLQGFSSRRFWVKNLLFAAGIGLVALAIAGPVSLEKEPGKIQNSADVLIALDVSNSMLATDVKPSRLEQSKQFIQQLVLALDGERIGLLFFAGEAYPQMPLSTDYEALLMFVRNADPDFITDQGTDIGAAVELGKRMLETSAGAGKALIVLSDGENHEEKALQRVREARESGLLVYAVSIGTAAGSTIPVRRGEMQRDFNGQTIRTSANETMLTSVANAGGGQAFSVQQGARAITALKEAIGKLQKNAVQANATTKKNYYFPWLLLLSLLVLVSEQVLWWRGKTMLLLLLGGGMATTATAQNNHRDLRSGDEYYEKQDFAAAQSAYQQAGGATGHYNAGNAAAKQQSLEDAAGFYQAALSKTSDPQRKADAWYNLGNVLLQQRKFADAIKAYESSLRLLPNQADAQKNLQIAKRQLQQPPPPTPPPPPPPPQRQPPPRRNYLDQALSSRLRETPPASLPPETARQMLSKAVLSEEQKNARTYRELSPATRASRLKKDW